MKPLALVCSLSTHQRFLELSSLVASELHIMGLVLEASGFEVKIITNGSEAIKSSSFPSWDGQQKPEVVWLHQAPLNIFGGLITYEKVRSRFGLVAKAIKEADTVLRLVIDTNNTMTLKQLFATLRAKSRRADEYPEIVKINEALVEKYETDLAFFNVGTFDPKHGPFIFYDFFAPQVRNTYSAKSKEYDFCYIGASRQKTKDYRFSLLEDYLDFPNSFFAGSLFKDTPYQSKKISFSTAVDAMERAKTHFIIRDPNMKQLPLHRYVQALACGAVPIVIGEEQDAPFIHNDELQKILRVSSPDEAKNILNEAGSLQSLLEEEFDYWCPREIKPLTLNK